VRQSHELGQAAPADHPPEQRQAFDDFLSLLSLLSIVLNLTR